MAIAGRGLGLASQSQPAQQQAGAGLPFALQAREQGFTESFRKDPIKTIGLVLDAFSTKQGEALPHERAMEELAAQQQIQQRKLKNQLELIALEQQAPGVIDTLPIDDDLKVSVKEAASKFGGIDPQFIEFAKRFWPEGAAQLESGAMTKEEFLDLAQNATFQKFARQAVEKDLLPRAEGKLRDIMTALKGQPEMFAEIAESDGQIELDSVDDLSILQSPEIPEQFRLSNDEIAILRENPGSLAGLGIKTGETLAGEQKVRAETRAREEEKSRFKDDPVTGDLTLDIPGGPKLSFNVDSIQKRKLQDREVATRQLIAAADDIIQKVEEGGEEALGAPGGFARLMNELAAQAKGFASQLDIEIEASLDPATYADTFKEIGIQNATLQSASIDLAFTAALAQNPGGKITDRDLREAIKTTGANLSDPAARIDVLRDVQRRTARNFAIEASVLATEPVDQRAIVNDLLGSAGRPAASSAPTRIRVDEQGNIIE